LLLFGHAGITLGVAAVISRAADDKRREHGWFASLSRYLDIRWLVAGSLLPDIIDKPVGQYFFRETFNNGRIFTHTLLFLIILSAAGFYLWKRHHQVWMLSLAAGTLMHLILDESWLVPGTLFWPLLGFSFPQRELYNWWGSLFQALFSMPGIFIPEIIGLLVVVPFALWLIFRKKVMSFLKYGKVD
jgi:inner membrane protein